MRNLLFPFPLLLVRSKMDSLQLAEFNEAFSFAFPEFCKPLIAICLVGLFITFVKKFLRIN